MAVIKSTDETFEKLKKENKIFLWRATADWCMPCKSLSPVLEEISNEMKGQIVIADQNIDSEPNVPTTMAVKSIPFMALFKDGKLVSQKVGTHLKANLVSWIKEYL